MEKGRKKASDGVVLHQWLDSVPRGEYNALRRRMVEECLVSKETFRNWLYGKCRIPMAAKRDINRVTKAFSGVDIFEIVKPECYSGGVNGMPSGETI